MDINLPKSQHSHSSLTTSKIDALALKLNQQLDVKVISSKTENQTLLLQTLQSNKPITVQSNLPIETNPGQSLQLLVTKLTPTVEFKIINSDFEPNKSESLALQNADKQLNLKALILKQIIPKVEIQPNLSNHNSSAKVIPAVITAKVIAIHDDAIQLKLYTTPPTETASYTKNLKQNILQQHNPIVTLSKEQLILAEIKSSQIKAKQPAIETFQDFKPGQKIQLELSKDGIKPEFTIIQLPKINLIQGQLVNAKVIEIKSDTIQLALLKNQTATDQPDNQLTQIKRQTVSNQNQLITVNAKQLSFPVSNISPNLSSVASIINIQSLKPEQYLVLEVKKNGIQPEFKIIEPQPPKLTTGQIIAAKVLDSNNNKIQLQLAVSSSPSSNQNTSTKILNQPPIISLNSNQLAYSTEESKPSPSNKFTPLTIHTLKPGLDIKLEVVKPGIHPEFKLIENKAVTEQKILETIKQVLPIQQPPAELVNQIIKTLPLINKNENVSDALKRIAREILDTIPKIKDINNPKQLAKSISNSGLFMEAKLTQYAEKNSMNFHTDFKYQLLKLQHTIKHALEGKKQQKIQSNELNLIKEMQQKTESTLAKIILNQLTSLPKEEGPRQVWVFDLPFLNKETADAIKIEIDQENQTPDDKKQENWTVSITVTPPSLATIHCRISCYDKSINTRFWSDTEDVVKKITQNMDYLKTQFEKAGINPGHMSAHKGVPATENQQKITDQSLFDQEV